MANHTYKHEGCTYADWPGLLAEKTTEAQTARYQADTAGTALLETLEKGILGSILAHGRWALRVTWHYAADMATWSGQKLYRAMVYVARVAGVWGKWSIVHDMNPWTWPVEVAWYDHELEAVGWIAYQEGDKLDAWEQYAWGPDVFVDAVLDFQDRRRHRAGR